MSTKSLIVTIPIPNEVRHKQQISGFTNL